MCGNEGLRTKFKSAHRRADELFSSLRQMGLRWLHKRTKTKDNTLHRDGSTHEKTARSENIMMINRLRKNVGARGNRPLYKMLDANGH